MRPAWIEESVEHLAADPVLGQWVERLPVPTFQLSEDLLESIISTIVYQQLSGKAAGTIYGRCTDYWGSKTPSASTLAGSNQDELRAVGLSRQKAAYLVDLGEKIVDGTVDLESMRSMTPDQISAHITQVKGLGPWSADMIAMFSLGHADVLPLGDLGIRNGFKKVYEDAGLTVEQMSAYAEPWRPFRTTASWYLWRTLEV
jgi:DNA-3-methyladenine glycosylase II